jgi:hypothetical protein
MAWSPWTRIFGLNSNPAANRKMGVYQVRTTSDNGTPKSIQRACGMDTEGVLYIGQGFLEDRVGRLLRICETNPKRHHNFIGVFLDYDLERIGDRKSLEIQWLECENSIAEEGRLIEAYKKRTGDIPPGNRKLGMYPVGDQSIDLAES